jgi:hypothetical protein
MNLLRRGVVQDEQCLICGKDDERVKHILWRPFEQDVWGRGSKKLQKDIGEGLTFSHVVEEMMERYELVKLELMALVVRKI